jgi:hypothetical protein
MGAEIEMSDHSTIAALIILLLLTIMWVVYLYHRVGVLCIEIEYLKSSKHSLEEYFKSACDERDDNIEIVSKIRGVVKEE